MTGTNADGNTSLHVAAFLCRTDVVSLFLEKGASTTAKNGRSETPIDVVSGAWSKELGDFYAGIASSAGFRIDLKQVEQDRPKMAQMLSEHRIANEKGK